VHERVPHELDRDSMLVSLLGVEVALHEALHAGCLVSRRFDRTPLAFRHEVDLAHAGHEIAVVRVGEVAVSPRNAVSENSFARLETSSFKALRHGDSGVCEAVFSSETITKSRLVHGAFYRCLTLPWGESAGSSLAVVRRQQRSRRM
jgi:hypothetical protein